MNGKVQPSLQNLMTSHLTHIVTCLAYDCSVITSPHEMADSYIPLPPDAPREREVLERETFERLTAEDPPRVSSGVFLSSGGGTQQPTFRRAQ